MQYSIFSKETEGRRCFGTYLKYMGIKIHIPETEEVHFKFGSKECDRTAGKACRGKRNRRKMEAVSLLLCMSDIFWKGCVILCQME